MRRLWRNPEPSFSYRNWQGDAMKSKRPIAASVGAFAVALAISIALNSKADADGDVKAGREKAQKCEPCHGLDGVSKIPEAPNIAGQSQQYLTEQLNAFKSGDRKNEMMNLVAPTLEPTDIDDLAAYYAAIEVTIKKVPGQ
jgi:cytochrome c553